MDFRSFAGSLLQSTAASQAAPLFYSTRADLATHRAADSHDDILGVSDESLHAPAQSALDRRFPLDASDLATDDTASRSAARSTAPGAVASHLSAIPAFVSRIGRAPARVSRGWKAYESVAAYSTRGGRRGAYSDSEDDEDAEGTDEEDEGPLPGAFVSQPAVDDEPHAMNEPLVGRRTLFVYPVPGPGGGTNSKERYQDSVWIVAYGVALLATLALGLQAWWSAPPLPVGAPSASVLSTLPTLSLLALISVVAGVATLAYILTIQRSLATLMTLSIFGGPLLFCATGIVAFAGSFSRSGVASDAGWTTGLACQTVLSHPALVLMALSLSLISAIVTLPFVSIVASLLAHGPQSPSLASWGTALTVLVFFWTLAIGRGLSHAIVGGCVGTWYFEREGEEYQGPLEVTKASIVRATGPLLGTVIAASFFLAVFESLATVLHAIRRALQSSRLPSYLRPLTALAPVFAALAGYAAFFNSYALSYAGMTGEPYWSSSRETAALFTANRARNIRDTALLRLTLFVSSTGWGLLAGLLAFFLSSSQLDARSGGYAPTLALLSYAIPMYTVKLCHNVISDAVDALFVCTHLDAENQLSHCPKAVEAFGTPEAESLGSFV
ncbi:hypothetical protein Rhopal_007681-T1 [Rhodotorula paludigena]|uniref:Protein PNS1 n=1 Tax=Rhodotorula paludigena TaxID=86838 RepID=A0AAV5H1J4_9BASI|nr:hypothetical protein Rhopal_007681-T1 [Rhodotorula paludigena]